MTSEAPIESFKALAHPVRYRILLALAEGERNVSDLEDVTGIAQPGLSQQLAVLRKAQLVTTRRDSKQVYYSIDPSEVARMQSAIAALAPNGTPIGAPGGQGTRHYGLSGAAVFAMMNG